MTNELGPYPEYRNSGVVWLGQVPVHWAVRRQRHAAELRVGNVDKHTHEGEMPVRLCNYVDAYKRERITSVVPFIPPRRLPVRSTSSGCELVTY